LPPEQAGHTRKLRIFTPSAEIPFAGHPTIGTAHLLAAIGDIPLAGETTQIVFEEGAGPTPVSIRGQAGLPVSAQLTAAQLPQLGPPPPPAAELAGMLSLEARDIVAEEVQAVSCGLRFLFIPLRSRVALGRVQLKREVWERVLSGYWAPQLYLFTAETGLDGADYRARMFAPALGIAEDPATGSAAVALAGYLAVRDQSSAGVLRWRVKQGIEMGRPSLLEIEAEKANGQVTAVRVGGCSVLVSEGRMTFPDLD
jgi:trans-2,3-dihydro-3-hydroxyanthranilate isomerase